MLVDERVDPRIGVYRVRSDVVRPGDAVPEMTIDGVDEKQLSVRIPVVSPRVGAPGTEGLEDLPNGMIAPERTAQGNASVLRCSGGTNFAGSRSTASPIEPAIRSETQTIGVVMIVLSRRRESIEHDLGGTGRLIAAICRGNKHELRWAHHPHPAAPDFDARKHLDIVAKNPARIEMPIPVLVLEEQNSVAQAQFKFTRPLGVGVVFSDPQPASRIPGKRDGILYVRLGGKHRGLKARRQRHLSRDLGGGHRGRIRIGLGVERRRKVGGARQEQAEGQSADRAETSEGHGIVEFDGQGVFPATGNGGWKAAR